MQRNLKTLLGTGALALAISPACPASRAADFRFATQTFTVPDGFEVELVAGPPAVNRPIMGDFDDEGRLYVADSSGATYDVKRQAKDKPHRMVRLEASKGDAHFDKSAVFADGLMFPEGVLWHDGAVYYSGVPSIWKLEDTDGDGVADKRTEWYQGKTMTGCANDLHGPYLGPDGMIYWCKGAFAAQTHERPGRSSMTDSAAHIFRQRPDGTEFDSVMSGGMDNPVKVVFTPTGEEIFTTTFYTNPDGPKRDALVHAIYGGVYPKVHGVIDGLKRTGDLMPAMTHLGPAAPCGLVYYSSKSFGDDYQGNLFSSQFNLRKVQRHILKPVGATFQTEDIDFMVSDNPDFHPTDIIEDADGSLLVIDTGGWYKVCCPTSQIAKPDVLGAIYRVRRKGAPAIDDPRALKLDWKAGPEEIAKRLDDPRPCAVKRALAALEKQGDMAVPALAALLAGQDRPVARLNAVWALARVRTPLARQTLSAGLGDTDPRVRQAAAFCAGLTRAAEAAPRLVALLKEGDDHLKTAAATSLGQIGAKAAAPDLLEAASQQHDRILEHAIIYALIEIGDPVATAKGLVASSPSTQRAAMIALDQMDGGGLRVDNVLAALNSSVPSLKETALWLAARHSDWGPALTGYFEGRLKSSDGAGDGGLEAQLASLAPSVSIQAMIAKAATDDTVRPEARLLALGAMRRSSLDEAPPVWAESLLRLICARENATAQAAVAAARALGFPKTSVSALSSALAALASNPARPDDLRLDALAALPGPLSPVDTGVFDFLVSRLDASRPPLERSSAAGILGRAKLNLAQLEALAGLVETAGPLEITKLLPAFDGATDEALGNRLVGSLDRSKSRGSLRPDVVRPRLAKFPANVQERGEVLLRALNANAARQKERLDELETGLPAGERNRGQILFSGAKAACFACHSVGYVGGHIGPDLSKIGAIRAKRDLLEAIVYPSASFVHGFEPMIVATRGGDEYSGIVRDESSDSLMIVTGPTTEQRVPRSEVAEIRPGSVSIMPEGLADQLTRRELADLVAFLRSLK
jgi:putative membrane-bound dehydrogenase-like protein